MTRFILSLSAALALAIGGLLAQNTPVKPVRVGIVGLVHDHVRGVLGRVTRGDIEIVGIAEPNRSVAEAYSKQYGFPMSLVYPSMEEMIEKTKPEAVLTFTSIYDHLKTVEYCAPRGIHVMVEKPLAVSAEAAEKMIALARQYHIYLITNYETTWYGSNREAWQLIHGDSTIGPIRKIVFYTGHQGPVEIGCSPQFLAWLTDPVLNGGGALIDFGCYGANLATWLMENQPPLTVTAVTQQMKPAVYPKVDDEATIILTYPGTQVIIQASWNWPYGRKEMEVYGRDGFVFCKNGTDMITGHGDARDTLKATANTDGYRDPFSYFARVIRGQNKVSPGDLSSPENNEIVVRILDAARESAKTGKTVVWKDYYPE